MWMRVSAPCPAVLPEVSSPTPVGVRPQGSWTTAASADIGPQLHERPQVKTAQPRSCQIPGSPVLCKSKIKCWFEGTKF